MIRVGIFFGGPSREREISFAGGRTVFDNLNKGVFEPVLLFVDSRLNLIQLDWHLIYKGTIRDFFPPAKYLPDSIHGFQVYDGDRVLQGSLRAGAPSGSQVRQHFGAPSHEQDHVGVRRRDSSPRKRG